MANRRKRPWKVRRLHGDGKDSFASQPAAFRRARELADHEAQEQIVWHLHRPTQRWLFVPGAARRIEQYFDTAGPSWTNQWRDVS